MHQGNLLHADHAQALSLDLQEDTHFCLRVGLRVWQNIDTSM